MKNTRETWKHIGDEITQLVSRIRCLCPDHHDPHRFHEEKSEIAHELNKLARRIRA